MARFYTVPGDTSKPLELNHQNGAAAKTWGAIIGRSLRRVGGRRSVGGMILRPPATRTSLNLRYRQSWAPHVTRARILPGSAHGQLLFMTASRWSASNRNKYVWHIRMLEGGRVGISDATAQ